MSFHDPAPLRPFVDKLVARSNLNVVEQDAILALPALPVQIQPNEDFVRLGDEVDHACFVVAGLVGRFSQILNGQRQITALHVATDMVDLHSVVVPTATSALQALSVTTILRIPHRALRAISNHYPAIAEAFWRECVIDAAVLAQWVVNVGRRSATARIAHLICEMAFRMEGDGANGRLYFAFPATQTHIADMVGLTPVHVNRILRALREDEIVDTRRRMIRILDWRRLLAKADFDPTYLHLAETSRTIIDGIGGQRPGLG